MVKALFIDVDGSLRNSRHEITPRTIQALKTVQRYNYLPILCTGNPYLYSARLSQEFNGTHIIASTGAVIYNCQTQKILYQVSLSQTDLQNIHQIVGKSDSDYAMALDGEYVRFSAQTAWERLWNKIKNHTIPQITLESYDFDYMLSICNKIRATTSMQVPNQSKLLTQNRPGPKHTKYFCDILKSGINKGSGIKTCCKLLGISQNNTISIGDDLNDLDMFAACKYNIAMGNALEQVKTAANYVTLDNDHDGLADFIEKKLLV